MLFVLKQKPVIPPKQVTPGEGGVRRESGISLFKTLQSFTCTEHSKFTPTLFVKFLNT